MLGYVIIGTVAGLLAFFGALLVGVSFWPALLFYSGVAVFVIVAAFFLQSVIKSIFGCSSARTSSSRVSTGIAIAGETSQPDAFALRDASTFKDIAGFVEYTTLKSYLTRLSRNNQERVSMFAIKVDQIERIQFCTPSDVRSGLLKITATAIDEVFRTREPLISYARNGIFLIVLGAKNVGPFDSAETKIESLLRARRFDDKNGDPIDIGVSIGRPARLDVGTKETRAKEAFARAIRSSEARELDKINKVGRPASD